MYVSAASSWPKSRQARLFLRGHPWPAGENENETLACGKGSASWLKRNKYKQKERGGNRTKGHKRELRIETIRRPWPQPDRCGCSGNVTHSSNFGFSGVHCWLFRGTCSSVCSYQPAPPDNAVGFHIRTQNMAEDESGWRWRSRKILPGPQPPCLPVAPTTLAIIEYFCAFRIRPIVRYLKALSS